MDTSKSAEWVARALVFSGRPDPTWSVPLPAVERLLGLWDRLRPRADPGPQPPALGYRGCVLSAPDGRRWLAVAGVVTLDDGQSGQPRDDPTGAFEQLLLSTAPEGTLPPR